MASGEANFQTGLEKIEFFGRFWSFLASGTSETPKSKVVSAVWKRFCDKNFFDKKTPNFGGAFPPPSPMVAGVVPQTGPKVAGADFQNHR